MKALRTTIETAFYSNHVVSISSLHEAYDLASLAPQSIVSDMLVTNPTAFGLPEGAKVIVTNDGKIVGRTAKARHIVGKDTLDYCGIMRDVIAHNHKHRFYASRIKVGLDEAFEVKAHVMVHEDDVVNLYNTLLNFEKDFEPVDDSNDESIFLYVDSTWRNDLFPQGLVILDPFDNVGAILGLNYFGEIKKGILSLAWNLSKSKGFIPCHGGLKRIKGDPSYTMAVFGLSGSGKSTITLSDHNQKFETEILHDDAFVLSHDGTQSIALEPSYFDKTADYPLTHPQLKYFLTLQNVGVTLKHGKRVFVTEDIRNGNGRTIKSKFCTPNRVNVFNHKINAVFWIMKDESFPPLIRIDNPRLGAIMGATMTTQRSNAENTEDVNVRVIEPFANPFRLYPLSEDYEDFKNLFECDDIACYILNTGSFSGKKVTPQCTLSAIESIVNNSAEFESLCGIPGMSVMKLREFDQLIHKDSTISNLYDTFKFRENLLNTWTDAYQILPDEVHETIQEILHYLDDSMKQLG
ncbi:hypothetical protein AOC36_09155 [Erysipelothrix larvae]|uniref:phosphoenolpyruvate carboxykinase (ATP) n=1 Tax=Erysipelothrix larvae TaxID=1514105 RepID=A0A0X8H129_9FIRM|nr:phosphoenolpyruvate carboxykinase (ATP) [Erysipelothrix larvae]AMC94149.1 hypothetical protein AOC36_09155 [Erysipelothrix larvae]